METEQQHTEPAPPLSPGIHKGLSFDRYRTLEPYYNHSKLRAQKRSLAHLKHYITTPFEDTPACRFGRSWHSSREGRPFPIRPDFGDLRTKKAREDRDAWIAEHGNDWITQEENDRLGAMTAALYAHIGAAFLETHITDRELTVVAHDSESGVPCKCRIDALTDLGALVDYKTTTDASPEAFAKTIENDSLYTQAAFYLDLIQRFDPSITTFIFIAIEKTDPIAVATYVMPDVWVDRGRDEIDRLRKQYGQAVQRDYWPAYGEQLQMIYPPRWANWRSKHD